MSVYDFILMEAEFRHVVLFYWRQHAKPRDILKEMQKSYGATCPSESFIRKWINRFDSGDLSIEDHPRSGRPVVMENIAAVQSCIEEVPSASARIIASIVGINKNTVINILCNVLHMKKKYAKWVPHILTNEQKVLRVETSKALKKILKSLSRLQLTATITCDETWLYLTYYEEERYLEEGKELIKPKRIISDPKVMIFTAFSTAGLVYFTSLPPNTTFNSATMCVNILPALKNAARNTKGIRRDLKLRIHMDNARPHTSKSTKKVIDELGFIQLPHPPFSPDISPNDFFLYGMLKKKLQGRHHETFDDLLKSVNDILNQIPKETWSAVYDEWIDRLNAVIDREGNYL